MTTEETVETKQELAERRRFGEESHFQNLTSVTLCAQGRATCGLVQLDPVCAAAFQGTRVLRHLSEAEWHLQGPTEFCAVTHHQKQPKDSP